MFALNFDGGSIGVWFAFLALRSAFLDGGSGALMSTSSSSIVASCRLRFLDDGSGEADLEVDVELAIFCEYSQTQWSKGSGPAEIQNLKQAACHSKNPWHRSSGLR